MTESTGKVSGKAVAPKSVETGLSPELLTRFMEADATTLGAVFDKAFATWREEEDRMRSTHTRERAKISDGITELRDKIEDHEKSIQTHRSSIDGLTMDAADLDNELSLALQKHSEKRVMIENLHAILHQNKG